MKRFLAYAFYNSLLTIFSLVDMSKWLYSLITSGLKLQSKDKRKRDWSWGQKFGLLPLNLPKKQQDKQRYLLHCASMGEVVAASQLILKLLQQRSELELVITTNTLTGKEQALSFINKNHLAQRVFHAYLPVDLPWLAKRLLKKGQVDKLIILEVELWPNLISQAKRLGLGTAVVNARMTDSSLKGYTKFSWLSQPMFQSLDQVFVRNQKDFDNYQTLMVTEPVLNFAGNIKFDIPLPTEDEAANFRQQLNINQRPVIVAGSTHEGEEQALLDACAQLRTTQPELLLLIAPRHPHRFPVVADLLNQQTIPFCQMSKNESANDKTQVILADQMGVLSQLYALADLVFIGGSLAKRGGHNPIEAAIFQKPIIMGPHIYNNPEIIDTLADNGGLVKVQNADELTEQTINIMNDEQMQMDFGEKNLATIKANSGVIAKLVEQL